MNVEKHDLAAQLARAAPVGVGRVEFLMNRPSEGVHVPVDELYLDVDTGIRGDRWRDTAWLRLPDGQPDPRVQVSLTNTQVIRAFTGEAPESHFRCGDNFYVDLNLTEAALPVGALIEIGEAILEVSDVENDACGKFAQRFGAEAFQCVRQKKHLPLRLRGVFCAIRQSGKVQVGDLVQLSADA
jgi:MOSC domain-containing protein YiiM